ncbi:MAG: cadherin-like beta sandwich domain-containing protein, partial [Lentimicrobiaceae bacterium]|nr:cadherin-like beta sandwich domain-containing protein [Lentimicrobiaceae bacterium]
MKIITQSKNFRSLKTTIDKTSMIFRNLRGLGIILLLLFFGTNTIVYGLTIDALRTFPISQVRDCFRNPANPTDGQSCSLYRFDVPTDASQVTNSSSGPWYNITTIASYDAAGYLKLDWVNATSYKLKLNLYDSSGVFVKTIAASGRIAFYFDEGFVYFGDGGASGTITDVCAYAFFYNSLPSDPFNATAHTVPTNRDAVEAATEGLIYNVEVAAVSNGSVSASKTSFINEGETIILAATPNSKYGLASITAYKKGDSSEVVTLNLGVGNTYTLTMPAYDVSVSASFTSQDATLSALTASPATLSPAFASGTYTYSATVPYTTSSVTLAATKSNASATVTGTGAKSLSVGANQFTVTVTAEDDDYTQTYTVNIYRESNVATLSSLTAGPATLSPAFASGTYTYYDTVPYATSLMALVATATDANASIPASNLGIKGLSVGSNQFTITVTAEDDSYTQVYTVNIYRQSNNAKLSGLTASPATLAPAFASGTYTYSATVPYATSSVTLATTTAHANATVTGAGVKALSVGANQFTITITAEDDDYTQTYTVNIYRESNVATLSTLIASPVTLSPAFASGTYTYYDTVPYATSLMALIATATDANASIPAIDLGIKMLSVGSNQFTITVTAEDDSYTQVYTINIYRLSSDATLSALTASPATLTPVFASGTYAYSATVPYATSSVTLAATKTNANATIPAGDLGVKTLSVGANQFTVTVTAEDNSTQVYTVNIYRESNDATLSSLTAGPATLSPAFSSGTYTYNDTVPYNTYLMALVATATDANATIPATDLGIKTLSVGANQFTITVTAEDDSYTQVYTVNVYRLSNDATLSGLTASPATLAPTFASGTYTYNDTVPYATSSVTLAATATYAQATVTGAGVKALAVGSNQFTVTVTSEDNSATLVYTVNIYRQSNDATLSALTASPAVLSPTFASGTYTYYDTVPYATDTVTLAATATDAKSSIPAGNLGIKGVSVGLNQFTITVTAEDDSYTQVYTVNIYRLSNDATLSALTASPATLAPAFASGTYTYNDTVPYATSSVTLAATATYSKATVTGAGVKALAVGSNQFTVTVTSEDNSATLIYTVNIYRQSNDATLSALTASPATLAPTFASGTYTYYDTVPYLTDTVTLAATTT